MNFLNVPFLYFVSAYYSSVMPCVCVHVKIPFPSCCSLCRWDLLVTKNKIHNTTICRKSKLNVVSYAFYSQCVLQWISNYEDFHNGELVISSFRHILSEFIKIKIFVPKLRVSYPLFWVESSMRRTLIEGIRGVIQDPNIENRVKRPSKHLDITNL